MANLFANTISLFSITWQLWQLVVNNVNLSCAARNG